MPSFTQPEIKTLYRALLLGTTNVPLRPTETLQEAVVHVAEACNLACTYCFADRGLYGKTLGRMMTAQRAHETVKALVKEYRNVGSIKFFGGEPFLNPRAIMATYEACRSAVDTGLWERLPEFGTVTNMTRVTDAVIDLINLTNMSVTGSIDGPPEINDQFRLTANGHGSFSRIDLGIRTMLAETGQPGSLEVVFGPHHLARGMDAVAVHEYLYDRYQIGAIVIHPMIPEPGVRSELAWDDYWGQMRKLGFDYGRYLIRNLDRPGYDLVVLGVLRRFRDVQRADVHCGLGVATLTFTTDGHVMPCYTLIGRDEFVMAPSVSDWTRHAARFQEVQQKFLSVRKAEREPCRSCDIREVCQACPGSMVHQSGEINVPVFGECCFRVGVTEGMLQGLIDTRSASRTTWDSFLNQLTTATAAETYSRKACDLASV